MANAILNIGQTGGQVNISTAAAPSTPAVGVVTLYAGTDKALHVKNSDGTDITIAAAAATPSNYLKTDVVLSANLQPIKDGCGTSSSIAVSCKMAIVGGCNNVLQATNTGDVIIGGCANVINSGLNNVIVGSNGARICSTNVMTESLVIIGGTNNCITNSNNSNAIIGGQANVLSGGGKTQIIVGGSNLSLSAGGDGFDSNAMLGGCCNTISGASDKSAIIGGESNCIAARVNSVIIGGSSITADANNTVYVPTLQVVCGVIGRSSTNFPGATGTIVIGDSSNGATGACNSVVLGNSARTTAACSIVIGQASCSTHAGAVALGPAITTIRENTTHVNSLVAFGQAASIAHAVGSTGGTATLNWDNSNVQTLTLTSSISSLTKSNPIDGGVYTVFVTQGGSGGYTVSWGADVKFAGGTGPTLSTAIGATDAVSLVYVAGITGYYGNANLNFA